MLENKINKISEYIPSIRKIDKTSLNEDQVSSIENIFNHYSGLVHFKSKEELRKIYLNKRDNLNINLVNRYSKLLTDKIIQSEDYITSNSIFLYLSIGSEFNTEELIKHSIKSGKKVCVPVVQKKIMTPALISNDTEYKTGYFGIKEPKVLHSVNPSEIDLVLVPGLVFNSLGYRIGYGGGYYDKFLNTYNGKTISVVFPGFVDNDFIPDYYDIPVDKLFI